MWDGGGHRGKLCAWRRLQRLGAMRWTKGFEILPLRGVHLKANEGNVFGGSLLPADTRANLSAFDRPMYSGIMLKLFPNWGRYTTNFTTIQPKFTYILHDRDAQVLQI